MYNFDNTIVSYADPRAIERREVYSSRPSYYVSKQQKVYDSPLRTTFHTTYGSQRIIEPQHQMKRTLTASQPIYYSPSRMGHTIVDMPHQKKITQEEPITKVTTTKQVYYPALYQEKKETIEFNDKAPEVLRTTLAAAPTYSKSYYQVPEYTHVDHEYDRDYEVKYNRHRSTSPKRYREEERDRRYREEEKDRKHRSRKHDKYHTSTYISPERNAMHTIPMQTYMPTYTVPVYNTTYYPAAPAYTPSYYYDVQSPGM